MPASRPSDRQADPALLASVRSEASSVPGVLDVEKLRVRKLGLEYLVDIHVQNETLSLLRASAQLLLLDAYAGLDAERATLAERVAELRRVRREREALEGDERELARQLDLLQFQIEEIGEQIAGWMQSSRG